MYNIMVKYAAGCCNNDLMMKMLKNGDVQFVKLKDLNNEVIHVTGYIQYTGINTDDQTGEETRNDYLLISTHRGYIRTGSSIFKDAFIDYIGDISDFTIRAINTKKGTTYKPEPILNGIQGNQGNVYESI